MHQLFRIIGESKENYIQEDEAEPAVWPRMAQRHNFEASGLVRQRARCGRWNYIAAQHLEGINLPHRNSEVRKEVVRTAG